MTIDPVLRELGARATLSRRTDGHWAEIDDLDVRALTRMLMDAAARWITMTVIPADDDFRLLYHWDLGGTLLTVATTITGTRVASVTDLLPAADWVEREMHDYYALEFVGRDETPALMLRPGDEPGLFSRTQDLGRDGDPAEYDETEHHDKAEPDDAASSRGAVA